MDGRKPWEIPIQYNEPDEPEEREPLNEQAIEDRISREPREDRRTYECNDTTPLDYSRGPHNSEYDCSGED